MTKTALFLISALLLPGFTQEPTYTLKTIRAVGQESTFEQSLEMGTPDGDISINMKVKVKTTKLESDGAYEVESTTLGGTMKAGGEEMAVPAGEPEIEQYDKDGKKIKKPNVDEDGEDPFTQFLEALSDTDPIKPVKIGEEWANKNEFIEATSKIVGKEKIGEIECLKVEVSGKLIKDKTSGEFTGTYYLRTTDFSAEKVEYNSDNLNLDTDGPSIKLKFVIRRES